MPSYWDFRLILNINPEEDRACIGIAKTYGRRCKNRINKNDRNTASRLLNQMNETKQFRSSIDDLEQLASLMLCKEVHNCKTQPHLSQVDEVCTRWTATIGVEYSHIKQMRKKAALLKAKKDFLRMQEKAAQARSELETESEELTERKPIVESYRRRPSKQPIITHIETEDPFITTKRADSTKSSLLNSVPPSAASSKVVQSSATLNEELNLSSALSKSVNLKPYIHWQPEISRATKASMNAPPTLEPTPTKPPKRLTKGNDSKMSATMTTTTSTINPEFAFDFGFAVGTKSTPVFDDLAMEGSGMAAKAQEPFTRSAELLGVSITPHQDQTSKPQPETQTPLFNFGTAVPDASTILSWDRKPLENPDFVTTLAKENIDRDLAFSFGYPVKFRAGQSKLRSASLLPLPLIDSLRVHADSPDSSPKNSEPRTVCESPRAPLTEKTITAKLRALPSTAPSEVITFRDDLKGKSITFISEIPLRNSASVESKMVRQHSSSSTTSEDEAAEVETGSHLEVLDDSVPSDPELQPSALQSDPKSITNADLDDDEDKENLPPLSTFEAKPHNESAQKLPSSEAPGFQIPGDFPDSPPQSELVMTTPSTPVLEDNQSNLAITTPSRPASEPDLEIPSTPSNRPSTPMSEPESEPAYGYALITPPKRYSAYLPSAPRYQHGLATPPDTPDNAQFLQILQDLGRRSKTRAPSPSPSPSPRGNGGVKAVEKPLPEIPTETGKCAYCGAARDLENGRREPGVDVGVQTEENIDVGEEEAGQVNVEDSEGGVRTGCMAPLSLGRLRNGLVRRFRGAVAQRRERKAEKRASEAII